MGIFESLGLFESLGVSIIIFGYLKVFGGLCRYMWISVSLFGSLWVFVGLCESFWVSLGLGFYDSLCESLKDSVRHSFLFYVSQNFGYIFKVGNTERSYIWAIIHLIVIS